MPPPLRRCCFRSGPAAVALALPLALLAAIPAQVTWQQVQSMGMPQARSGAAIASSPAGGMLLFGGHDPNLVQLNDTWEWIASVWLRRQPASAPPPRSAHAMVFDSKRGRVVLFGGWTGQGANYLGDTWEFDGANWTQRNPATSPAAREKLGLAYDAARGRTVLFGGYGGSAGRLGDTWEWDGATWVQRNPATSPSPRAVRQMTYDAGRQRVVLFGGSGGSGSLADTWEWDGQTWLRRSPPNSPPALPEANLAYDSSRGRVVLVTDGSRSASEVWEWDGTDWTRRQPAVSPPRRGWPAFAFDPVRERTVLFSGWTSWPRVLLGDQWEYGPVYPASTRSFGAGCAGSFGTATLTSDTRPWIAGPFETEVRGLGTRPATWMVLGLSNTTWSGQSLPLDLGGITAPGCRLFVSLHVLVVGIPAANGVSTLKSTIPNDPTIAGRSVYLQAFVPDTRIPLAATNALEVRIGAR